MLLYVHIDSCEYTPISFIAPSLAATGIGAIILRSSLTGLRMTAGRPSESQVLQMRPTSIIYRCYEKWKGGLVKCRKTDPIVIMQAK
jgi:hypothetical protein